MIKVVHIQYSTESGGSSAFRLHTAFKNANIESSIISLQEDFHKKENFTYLGKWSRLIAKIDSLLQIFITRKKDKKYELFSYPILGSNITGMEEVKKADFIYIHWVQNGLLSISNLEKIAKLNKPIIIIMHDMWSITGGCHYSLDCEKFITGCFNCPMFPSGQKNQLTVKSVKQKIKLYSRHNNFFFVSPSKWLYDISKQALLTKNKPVFYIPNVIDSTLFKPFDKKIAKDILNIEHDFIVIAFGAVSINSNRKGWVYLQKALVLLKQKVPLKKIVILIFGSAYNIKMADKIPFKTIFMGYLYDTYSTVLAYNAADVFIVPSLADNQPTTVQESLSCGTPVVGFNIGGISDMINHKENGYLAEYKNHEDLAKGILVCLQNNIRGNILESFELHLTVKKHFELFDYINSIKNLA